jgi:hypothetical protein
MMKGPVQRLAQIERAAMTKEQEALARCLALCNDNETVSRLGSQLAVFSQEAVRDLTEITPWRGDPNREWKDPDERGLPPQVRLEELSRSELCDILNTAFPGAGVCYEHGRFRSAAIPTAH